MITKYISEILEENAIMSTSAFDPNGLPSLAGRVFFVTGGKHYHCPVGKGKLTHFQALQDLELDLSHFLHWASQLISTSAEGTA